jgi:hypothetical protein
MVPRGFGEGIEGPKGLFHLTSVIVFLCIYMSLDSGDQRCIGELQCGEIATTNTRGLIYST